MDDHQKAGGIVAWSSGNHGLALSYVDGRLGIRTLILLPDTAPKVKIDGVKANGAEVRLYDKSSEVREEIAEDRGGIIVPPYDDPGVITGQVTLGREFAEQALELDHELTAAAFCCSGGGLTSGGAAGLYSVDPGIHVLSVEPERFDGMARSLGASGPVRAPAEGKSICDALLVPIPGDYTLPICRAHGVTGLSVTDAEVIEAMRFAFAKLKLLAEPGGAAALAALLAGKIPCDGGTCGIVLSGGNTDPDRFAGVIQATPGDKVKDRRPC